MRRSLRAAAVILAGALAALATGGAPAHAATVDPPLSTHDLQIAPVGAGNQPTSDTRLSASLDPGASVERSFVITNRTSGLRLTVRLAAVDATAAAGGEVKFAADASASGPASWLTLSDVVATLEPKAQLRVTLTITPPGNVEPGSVFAGVVARVDRSVRMADGADGPKSAPISLPVAVEVKGAATALVSVVGVNAVKRGDRGFLEVTFQNGGATANTMVGTLKVLGSHPQSFDLHAAVAPLGHTVERVAFTMPGGAKDVPVAVDTQDASGNQAAWSGKVGYDAAPAPSAAGRPGASRTPRTSTGAASHTGLVPLVLYGVVALALVLGAVWFGAEVRRSRRRVRVRDPLDESRVRVRRVGRTKVTPIPIPTALRGEDDQRRIEPAAPVVFGDGDAVAAKLGELVHAIDRLVSRLGEVAADPITHRRPAPPDPEPAPDDVTARAESGAILYAAAAAAPSGPERPVTDPPVFDPYDWPTEEQLDEFIARRKTGRADPPR